MEKDPLSLETRRRVFQLIRERPGTYMREIERELDMQPGVLQYNLRVLEEMKLITSEGDGFRKRYFVVSDVSITERRVLSVLRQETPRRIVIYLLQHPGATSDELLSQFSFSRSALSFHMKRLTAAGLVRAERTGRASSYSIIDPDMVARVIITYRTTFIDRLVDSFVESWLRI